MKNYTITVNGQTYVVQVEEGITAAAQAAPVVTIPQAPVYAAPAPVAAPAPAPAPAPQPAPVQEEIQIQPQAQQQSSFFAGEDMVQPEPAVQVQPQQALPSLSLRL